MTAHDFEVVLSKTVWKIIWIKNKWSSEALYSMASCSTDFEIAQFLIGSNFLICSVFFHSSNRCWLFFHISFIRNNDKIRHVWQNLLTSPTKRFCHQTWQNVLARLAQRFCHQTWQNVLAIPNDFAIRRGVLAIP